MKILAIETSCDETAIAIIDGTGDERNATFKILGEALLSQIDIHQEYGGVYPVLAKRAHAENLVPLLTAALEDAELLHEDTQIVPQELHDQIAKLLEREPSLDTAFLEFISETEIPDIDAIAVTAGPGLEPALWVGVNFAKALSLAWSKPVIAVNHLEGHILAGLAARDGTILTISNPPLPILALLISGGHTELVLMKHWMQYELIGRTRDDAVGEAFDKVARMLELSYPGGPQISILAEGARRIHEANPYTLPRPMIDSSTCDFSFAGLKTAVLYLLKNKEHAAEASMIYHTKLSDQDKMHLAREFEDAVADVLWSKTEKALRDTGAKTLVIGGGVSANTHIRRVFEKNIRERCGDISLYIPSRELTTDNALMIALAGFYHAQKREFIDIEAVRADGNLSLATASNFGVVARK